MTTAKWEAKLTYFGLIVCILSIHILATASSSPVGDLNCPLKDEISPCTCVPDDEDSNQLILSCQDDDTISQKHVDKLFTGVRAANNRQKGDELSLKEFSLENTRLTSLDLTPFAGVNFTKFCVQNNEKLVRFTSSDEKSVQFKAIEVIVKDNSVNSLGMANLLRAVDPMSVRQLDLSGNRIEGISSSSGKNQNDSQIVPGLSNFALVEKLNLANNSIAVFNPREFSQWDKLKWMDMTNNGLTSLERHPFYFGSRLSQIFVAGNNFHCDSKMKWLTEVLGMKRLEYHLFGAVCQNDPEKADIFKTKLSLQD